MKKYEICFATLVILLVVMVIGMKFFDTRVIEDSNCYDKKGNVVQGLTCDLETVYFYGINEGWFEGLCMFLLLAMLLTFGLEMGDKIRKKVKKK